MNSRRYAFVVPRFGDEIVGGAETLVGHLAARLKERGDDVWVFTTCARDNRTWANEFPEGEATAYGVPVRRFPVDQRDLEVWIPKQIAISEGMNLSLEDQLTWMEHSVNSAALYSYIRVHADQFDALFFAPYLFGTTFWGALTCPDKSFLIPCLHDEHYAYTDVLQSLFRQVAGALFNAEPEMNLARQLYGEIRGGEVGMGFVPPEERVVAGLSPFFEDDFPYLLYLGRKETGKNAQLLIDYFVQMKDCGSGGALKLVIAGGGSFEDLHRVGALSRGDILDLRPLSEEDKNRLIKHALAVCQPSVNESFSIVIMEGWLLGVPALVHADCAVTRHHVIQSGGGLYFSSAKDFAGAVEALLSDRALRDKLAAAGGSYVRSRYSWSAVLGRFDAVMNELLGL